MIHYKPRFTDLLNGKHHHIFYKKTKNLMRKKKIVFINAEWCNTCRVMYRTTFSDTRK